MTIISIIGGLMLFAGAIAMVVLAPLALLFATPVLALWAYFKSDTMSEFFAKRKTMKLYRLAKKHMKPSQDSETYLDYHWPNLPEELHDELLGIARNLYYKVGVTAPLPQMPVLFDTVEGGRYRDELIRIINGKQIDASREVAETISEAFARLIHHLPSHDGPFDVKLRHVLDNPAEVVQDVASTFFGDTRLYFRDLVDELDRRVDQDGLPVDYKADDVVEHYFGGTPLSDLFKISVPFGVSDRHRFEHIHMVAQIGHGKTQAMQNFIVQDLEKDASVIVIDSQGEMIQNLLGCDDVDQSRVVYINPRDVKHPPALNLFDASMDRINTYRSDHKEQITNATIEIYEYLMGGIFGADLTSKQGVAFRFVIRLILSIPGATIDTLLEIFRDPEPYQKYIHKLGKPGRDFFNDKAAGFPSSAFRHTREEVIRRILTIAENPTLYRMFSNPECKVDLFEEMNNGSIILIDTAKDMLKEEGSTILGRFFMAKVVQAAQERATIHDKKPCYVYVDEAQDYFDNRTEVFLSQLRKQRVGGFFAHQYLDQLPHKLGGAFMANTNTKLVGGVSVKDAKAFSGEMRRPPEFLSRQPKGTFVTMTPGLERALPINIPFFVLEKLSKRSKQDMKDLIYSQRLRFSTVAPAHPSEKAKRSGKSFSNPVIPEKRRLPGPTKKRKRR